MLTSVCVCVCVSAVQTEQLETEQTDLLRQIQDMVHMVRAYAARGKCLVTLARRDISHSLSTGALFTDVKVLSQVVQEQSSLREQVQLREDEQAEREQQEAQFKLQVRLSFRACRPPGVGIQWEGLASANRYIKSIVSFIVINNYYLCLP